MDIKEIKRLVKLMIDNDLTEMNIVDGDEKISLKRGPGDQSRAILEPAIVQSAPAVVQAPAPVVQSDQPAAAEPANNMIDVTSPMVGTFYSSSNPDSGAYVSVGDTINDSTVVCIVEAMKVMNEIKAECSGKVAEICVTDAQPVEFGQVLFRLAPA
ncbi:MAG: acetyl-CoA carboxylase biotin carboxyl carrier protein [Phycisphaerae bacterium]|jgi:acetyl-CoA carboxylase biotin carboxyl carrier protein|nr:acetyl-CoA carboxylase biotin carboxyl carrier protein [Phycisphaerae bacterium]MDP7287550.1 acetyl-CoA carboxylase biotin carboxyl carrier protein [Phycisphaerae bacterium]